MKRVLIILILILLLAGLLYYCFSRNNKAANDTIKVSGNIEATEVDVGFKISGRIVNRFFEEGDWVDQGKVLAKLDDEDLLNRLAVVRASLDQAKFDLENKQAHYERMKPLFERGVIPKDMYDSAEAGFKMAEAVFEQAKASVKLNETQLSYTTLYSPISGVVLVKSGEIGEVVNPGTPIVTLADIEDVWLKAYIPETDLSRVKWGQEVAVTTDLQPKKEYRGKISFISSQAEFTPKQIQTEKERVTLVYRMKIDIQNPNHELKPGMPADGKIVLSGVTSGTPQNVK